MVVRIFKWEERATGNNLIDLKSGRGLQTGQSLPESSYLLRIPPTSSSCFEDRLGWGWALLLISYQFSHLSPHCLMHAGSVVTMVIHQRHSCISIANIHQLPTESRSKTELTAGGGTDGELCKASSSSSQLFPRSQRKHSHQRSYLPLHCFPQSPLFTPP